MFSLQFWKSWPKSDQIIFWTLAILTLASIIFFWQGWFIYPAPVITNEHFQQIQQIETASHSFQVGLTNFVTPADSHVIFEYVFGSQLHPNVLASYFFLGGLFISFVLFVCIISTCSRFWFLIGMGLVMLFLASLRLDALEVFGLTNKTITIVAVLVFGSVAFYFHSIKKDASFSTRVLVFVFLIAVIASIVFFFSKTAAPFLHLAVNGLLAGIILTLIFILMVAHEIVAAFVSLTTRSLKSSKSLQHFLVLTIIYLANLALLFASKMGFIEWSFFSVSSFFVLTVSVVLGVWGFRQRSAVYENILSTEPIAIFFFFSITLTAFSAMGYFASSASDMMMDALDDLILAAHLGGGIIFTLYIIANFGPMLVKNLAVYKVLYKPETMPHFTYRLMSTIAIFAVLSLAVSWKTYVNQATATYYHAYGDLYLSQNDDVTAKAYYTKSLQFRNQNLHAHYALATLFRRQDDSFNERMEYEKTIEWSPSVPVYLNLSHLYAQRNDLLEAAITLDAGKKKFPKSGELQNAVGLSYLKLKLRDSALYSFLQTRSFSETQQMGEINYLGASAVFNLNQATDSVVSFSDLTKFGQVINSLAFANEQNKSVVFENKFKLDTALSVYQAMLLCNYLINKKETADTSLIHQALLLAHKPVNDDFKEQLIIASAHALYARGEVKRALQSVREVAYRSGDGKTFSLLGLWLLEQNNPSIAARYFKQAAEKEEPLALYYQAFAETESESLNQAYVSWDSLQKTKDKALVSFAEKMKRVLLANMPQALNLPDDEKYYFCRYKIALYDSATFLKVINTMNDPALKSQTQFDRAKKWFTADEVDKAISQLNKISSVSKRLKPSIDQLGILLAAEKKNTDFIRNKLNNGIEIPIDQKLYVEALLAEENGNAKVAREKYLELANANDQFEEGIVSASRFLAKDATNRLASFSLLVDGLLAKPNSIKILKQHVLESIALGFDQAAQDSLDKLRVLMDGASFKKFIASHHDLFTIEK